MVNNEATFHAVYNRMPSPVPSSHTDKVDGAHT